MDSFSAFVDWPNDRLGMIVLRDFTEPGAPPPDPASLPPHWHGGALRTAPLPPLMEATGAARPLRATSAGRWHDVLLWFMEVMDWEGV